jgi:hypothetical protein
VAEATASTIAELVEQLAVQTTAGGQTGRPLLVQLRRAVWGDIGQTRSGVSRVQTMPINGDAYDVWKEITQGNEKEVGISDLYESALGTTPSPSAVVNLLAWHSVFAAAQDRGDVTETMLSVVTGRLSGWVRKIQDQLASPFSVALRDFACPNCGEPRVEWGEGELRVEGCAIVITLEDGELVARCRNPHCVHLDGTRSKWTGDIEVTYMARRAGIDVELLADSIREARQPKPELPYNPEEGKKILVPLNLNDPEHLELVRAAHGRA